MDRLTSTHQDQSHSIAAARESVRCLEGDGFDVPRWEDLGAGLRPHMPPMEEGDIYQPKHVWQHLASRCTDTSFVVFTRVAPSLSEAQRAVLRSQRGPLVACPFTCVPMSRLVRFDPQPFRVLLLHRLRLPFHLAAKACRCGRLHDVFSHHRSACAASGVLGGRAAALSPLPPGCVARLAPGCPRTFS